MKKERLVCSWSIHTCFPKKNNMLFTMTPLTIKGGRIHPPLRFSGMLIGFLGDAASAEMDIQIVFYSETGEELSRELKTIRGKRDGAYNLHFPEVEDGRDGKQAVTTLSALRFYDADGKLLEEKIYEVEDLFEEG